MRKLILAALLAGAAAVHAQDNGKKDLVQKLLVLQQPGIEQVSRGLVERPAIQMMQQVAPVIQQRVPPDKREALGKQIKYADQCEIPLSVVRGSDERDKGIVTIKDMGAGKARADAVAGRDEWLGERPGQIEVPREGLVAAVRELLAKIEGTTP